MSKRVMIDESRNEVYLDTDLGTVVAFSLKLSRQGRRSSKAPRSDELWDGNRKCFRQEELTEEELLSECLRECSTASSL